MCYIIEFLFKATRYTGASKSYTKATGKELSKLSTIYGDNTVLVSGMPENKDVAHNLKHGHIYHHIFTFTEHYMILLYYGHHLKSYVIQIPYSNIKKWSYYVHTHQIDNEPQNIPQVSYYVYCNIYIELKRGYIELRDLDINKNTGSRFIDILENETGHNQRIVPWYDKMTNDSSVSGHTFINDVLNTPQNYNNAQQQKHLKNKVESNIGHKIDQSYYLNNYVPED